MSHLFTERRARAEKEPLSMSKPGLTAKTVLNGCLRGNVIVQSWATPKLFGGKRCGRSTSLSQGLSR